MAERAALQEKMRALPTPAKKDNFHVSADSAMNQNLLSLYEQIRKANGLTEDGRTLFVEINDGFARGSYGLDPIQYAKLLSAHWPEITGIHDECDVFFEGADWRKKNIRRSLQL